MSVKDYLFLCGNVFALLGLAVLWLRMNRPAKEDPRLSKGLQLLQSKIAILEDLSDRTDHQVRQMLRLLENQGAQVQESILTARETIHLLEQSMGKSLEIAEIFEDKIPHEEIVDRQNSKKYIEAAKLAHAGWSCEKIAEKVDLDLAEIEFIAKVNKDRLMFNEEELPPWAQASRSLSFSQAKQDLIDKQQAKNREIPSDFEETFARPTVSLDRLQALGQQFREACEQVYAEDEQRREFTNKLKSGVNQVLQTVIQPLDEVRSAIQQEWKELGQRDKFDAEAEWEDFLRTSDEDSEPVNFASSPALLDGESKQDSSVRELATERERDTYQRAIQSPGLSPQLDFETSSTSTATKEAELKKLLDQPLKSSSMFAKPELNPALQTKPTQTEEKAFGKVSTKEDGQNWDLVQKRPQHGSGAATITTAQKTQKAHFQMDLVDRIRQRAKERRERNWVSKIQPDKKLSNLQSLEFPPIDGKDKQPLA